MAKQPGGSSADASAKPDPAQNIRQTAEATLAQAKQAVDQYMREAVRLYGAMELSVEAATISYSSASDGIKLHSPVADTTITVDSDGFILDYPGLAERI